MRKINYSSLAGMKIRKTVGLNRKILEDISKTTYFFDRIETKNAIQEKTKDILLCAAQAYQVGKYATVGSLNVLRSKLLFSKALHCSPREVITNENELLTKGNAEYYIGDLCYKGNMLPEKLASLSIVWGDLDISALQDTSCLSKLEVIGGNAKFQYKRNLSLPSLKYVLGDLHIEALANLRDLSSLKCVTGSIYYNEQVYNFSDFQTFCEVINSKSVCKRQYVLLPKGENGNKSL